MLVEQPPPPGTQKQKTTQGKEKKGKNGFGIWIRSVPLRLSSEKKGLSAEPRFVARSPVGQVGRALVSQCSRSKPGTGRVTTQAKAPAQRKEEPSISLPVPRWAKAYRDHTIGPAI